MGEGAPEIVVAGAGVAGLAVALALRKAGRSVTVLEQAASIGPVGAGILIQANGLLVLDALGLGDKARAAGVSIPRLFIRDRHGRILFRTEFEAHLPSHLLPVTIHRAQLHEILWNACVAMGVRVDLGCTVTSIDRSGRSPLVVHDSPRGVARLAGELLIGADGVNSAVRETGGFSRRFWPVVEGSIQGVAPFPVPDDRHGEYIGGDKACGLLPLGNGRTFWFWGGSDTRVAGIGQLSFEGWRKSVCNDFPAMRLVLDEHHDWSGTVRLLHRSLECDSWSAGNVVLIGDAAHAMSPNLGQGANSALVDALALVGHLVSEGGAVIVSNALSRFERDRRPMVEALQKRGHRDAIAGVQHWPGLEQILKFTLRLARFAPDSRQRADIRLMCGLTGEGFDIRAAGVSAPLPWSNDKP